MKYAHEIEGLRSNGEVYTGEVLGHEPEQRARELAQEYADLWGTAVRLYRVPVLHLGSAPWKTEDKTFVFQAEPRRGCR
jgi:hypothetical protein